MTDVLFIYFSLRHFSYWVNRKMSNEFSILTRRIKIVNRLFLYNVLFFSLSATLFPTVCLNVKRTTRRIKINTMFVQHFYFLCDTFFPTVLHKMLNKFCVLRFINSSQSQQIQDLTRILCRLHFYLLAYLSFSSGNLNVRFWKRDLNLARTVGSGRKLF